MLSYAQRDPDYLPERHTVNGFTYHDLERGNAHEVIAVVTDRPLTIIIDGTTIAIPEGWVKRARRDLGICPTCASLKKAMRLHCPH